MALADVSPCMAGAMMIAMGMLVDNAIVVVEGMLVGVQMGMKPVQAAKRGVSRTQFPLLGATVIGILALAPIGLSNDASGHFLVSYFKSLRSHSCSAGYRSIGDPATWHTKAPSRSG